MAEVTDIQTHIHTDAGEFIRPICPMLCYRLAIGHINIKI